jgi:hypothetical protein
MYGRWQTVYTQINGRLDADRQTGSRRQTNRQASRGRQTDDIMKRFGKAEGRQTDSRTAGCPKTDWQVGDRIIQYKQASDIQRIGKRQT